MSTEVDEAPELVIGETIVTLTDDAGKTEVDFETVGKMSFRKSDGKDILLFVNVFVPTKEDGSQDESKPLEYVVTDSKGEPVDDEEVQEKVVSLFIADITQEGKE